MKNLRKITVIGLGLLGGSITLSAKRSFPKVKVTGYAHRASTCRKARRLSIADQIVNNIKHAVFGADIVILATPISTFEEIFGEIAHSLADGCIVTDVGSTKVLSHRWAQMQLPKKVYYVGSHPIAGSEQRGVEFARDDLFEQAMCILTMTKGTNRQALRTLKGFWSELGCRVQLMSPAEHDRILANISHLPHIVAAALINASNSEALKFAGKGFIDTTRIASGPANIWADVLLTNSNNIIRNIDKIIAELEKAKSILRRATKDKKALSHPLDYARDWQHKNEIEKLLETAQRKRSALINYKIRRKELIL